ncbi:MAG: DUF6249 domain-containing protein [Chloroflexota bacterium]
MNDFIPCAGGLGFVGLILGFILLMRYLSYKETLALAEKGLVKPARSANGNGNGALIWGVILSAVGVALLLGLWPLGYMFDTDLPLAFGPWMLIGLLPLFFGLALILIHVLTRKKPEEDQTRKDEPKE